MVWIINDIIKFVPESKLLISLVDSELKATLTTPASHCFSLLLEAAPAVVSQKELFEKVWAEDSMIVTTNTLYQNISLIRRGMRTVGLTDDSLIVTMPRKGFKIGERIRLRKIPDESMPATPFTAGEQPPFPEGLKETFAPEENHLPVSARKKGTVLSAFTPVALFLSLFCLGFFGYRYILNTNETNNFFRSYKLFDQENNCRFYSKIDDVNGQEMFHKFKKLIIKSNLDCKTYPWVYFSSSASVPVLSAIVCKHENFTGCVTLYFRETDYE